MARQGWDAVVAAAGDVMGREGVDVGRSIGGEVLTVHGRIFAFPHGDGLVVKLPAAQAAELLAAGRAEPMVMGQRTMKAWVLVPASAGEPAWHDLIDDAFQHVAAG